MADPGNIAVIDDLKFITRYDIFPVLAGEIHAPQLRRETLRRVGRPDGRAARGHCRRRARRHRSLEDADDDVRGAAMAAAVDDAPSSS
jgi:type IV pilus assembly protein PilB